MFIPFSLLDSCSHIERGCAVWAGNPVGPGNYRQPELICSVERTDSAITGFTSVDTSSGTTKTYSVDGHLDKQFVIVSPPLSQLFLQSDNLSPQSLHTLLVAGFDVMLHKRDTDIKIDCKLLSSLLEAVWQVNCTDARNYEAPIDMAIIFCFHVIGNGAAISLAELTKSSISHHITTYHLRESKIRKKHVSLRIASLTQSSRATAIAAKLRNVDSTIGVGDAMAIARGAPWPRSFGLMGAQAVIAAIEKCDPGVQIEISPAP